MSITVVDSIMGSGKSTWAFNYINSNPDKRFIYVTPFIEECNRAVSACRSVNMVQPREAPKKTTDFKKLVESGQNIATTHSLFCQLTLSRNEIERIRGKGYILLIDEVFETVQVFEKMKNEDLNFLVENNYIQIDEDGKIHPSRERSISDLEGTAYDEVLPYIKAGSLVNYNGKILLRIFPIETLELSEEIYILTYLFEASHLKYTFEMNNLTYETRWINNNHELTDVSQDYSTLKNEYKCLIHIYDGRMNDDYENEHALSSTKWNKKYSKEAKKKIANHARSFFTYGPLHQTTPAEDCLWAVYGEKKKIKGTEEYQVARKFNITGYSESCIPFNERATNQYSNCYMLAYLVNVFEFVGIKKWFESKGIKLDDDLFALSILIQWIWRSRIRNNEGDRNIYLYLPSKRMRRILMEWLESQR